jgi:hypothetical protein
LSAKEPVKRMRPAPSGSVKSPRAFVDQMGRLRVLHECGPAFTGVTAINDAGPVAEALDKAE